MTSTPTHFQDYCRAELTWQLDTIETLARVESPSDSRPALARCAAELSRRLTEIGGRVTALPQTHAGDHLRAEFGTGARQILLLGHYDTVWSEGTLARMPVARRDDRLYGPGVFDMKAGITIGMLATRALLALHPSLAHRIVMLWTSDEEVGSTTSRALIENEARRSDAVFVLEPALPGGALKTSRKGVGQFELRAHGISAHAGIDPTKGVNAILELSHQIVAVSRLSDPARGVSVSAGTIHGGTRTNVVPEEAHAVIDVRVPTLSDASRIDAAFRALTPTLAQARLDVTGGIDRPPLERTAMVVQLYEIAKDVARDLGQTLNEGGTGGGSDGNFTAAIGVPTLDGLGAVGDGAHATHEHVSIADLSWRTALLAGLVARVSQRYNQ